MCDQEVFGDWCRSLCLRGQNLLVDLAQVHCEIDPPFRTMRADDPNWIGRLRKILHHVRAIMSWELSADVEHVLASELRAAYRQMEFVWKELPDRGEVYEWHRGYWRREAAELGRYDHPTGYNLYLTFLDVALGGGGTQTLARLAEQIHRLGLGYALALDYLSQILDKENHEDTGQRLAEILQRYPLEPPEALRAVH